MKNKRERNYRWSFITNNWSLKKGFTLIELLVVVAIIGVLSALLLSNFIGVRQRARDAQRKSDIRQMQAALELYRADVGSYPVSAGSNNNVIFCKGSIASGGNTYMVSVPCDPLGSSFYNAGNYFYHSPNGSGYTITACLENKNDPDAQYRANGGCPQDNSDDYFYIVTNP